MPSSGRFAIRGVLAILLALTGLVSSPQAARAQLDALFRQAIGAAITQGRMQPGMQPVRPPAVMPQQLPGFAREPQAEARPSFNCRGRSEPVELAICGDGELARLDREMAAAYVDVLRRGADPRALKSRQRVWLDNRRMCQSDRACIRAAYRQRTAQLRGDDAVGGDANTLLSPGGSEEVGGMVSTGQSPLILPQLLTFQGKVVLGSGGALDDERWLRLVNLGVDPSRLQSEPQRLAYLFLPKDDPFNTSDAWRSSNEFRSADIKDDFLRTYGAAFRRAAIRLPVQFATIQEITFQPYDRDRRGFPLRNPEQLSLPGLNTTGLKLDGAIAFPGDFWPLAEAEARRLLGSSRKIGAHAVSLMTVFELRANDRQPGTQSANWVHAYLLDPDTRRIIHDFGSPQAEPSAALSMLGRSNPFSAWMDPPAEFKPWRLPVVDGAFTVSDSLTLWRMIAAGNFDAFLTDQQYFYQRVGLGQTMLSPSTYSSIFFSGSNFKGADEFEQSRSAKRFESLLPALKAMAPKAPFDMTVVQHGTLSTYDSVRGGFTIHTTQDFGLVEKARDAGLTLAPSFSWPNLFWPLTAEQAERLVKTLPNRAVDVAARVTIDSADTRTGRVQMSLRSVNVHRPKSDEILFKFLVRNDSPATGVAASGMTFTQAAPLDDVFICAEWLAATRQIADSTLQTCAQIVWRRDAATYADATAFAALSRSDARYPFFPRDGVHLTSDIRQRFFEWAEAYSRAAARDGVVYRANESVRTPAGMTIQAAGHGFDRSSNGYSNALSAEHLRAEQIVRITDIDRTPVDLILPNLAQAYTVDVDAQYLNHNSDGGVRAITRLRPTGARLIRDDTGKDFLALFMRPERVDVTSQANGAQVASRVLSTIPDFAAPLATSPAGQGQPLPLDLPMLDLLTARYVGLRLSPEAFAYLIERRWRFEMAQNGAIDRFFEIGSRAPSPELAVEQRSRFIAWAKTHAPSLPLTGVLNGAFEANRSDASVPLDIFPCLNRTIAELMGGIGKAEGQGAVIRGFNGACRYSDVRLPFQDPLTTLAAISGDLPVPTITVLGGKQSLLALATFTIDSVAGFDHMPTKNDRFAQDQEAVVDRDQNIDGPQNFVGFRLTVSNVVYRDAKTSAPVASRSGRVAPAAEAVQIPAPGRTDNPTGMPGDPRSGPSTLDVLGIKLGMTFEEAETRIREHMEIGSILNGVRLYDEQARQGFIKPMTSGKLFVSKNGRELIALIDEPPAAAERVLTVWRRVYSPDGNILPDEVMAGLTRKYGEPNRGAADLSSSAQWSTPAGQRCSSFYNSSRTNQLSDLWYRDGRPADLTTTNPRGMVSAALAAALFDPLEARNKQWTTCGPFMTASYHQTHGLSGPMDELDIALTDFGRYADAFAASRAQLQRRNPDVSNEARIKF